MEISAFLEVEELGYMPKLYFRYGTMNSSKTAQALMIKYNYEQQGKSVALLKPAVDDRYGPDVVKSRIGLESKAIAISSTKNIYEFYIRNEYQNYSPDKARPDVIIVDEAQFLTAEQVDQLKELSNDFIPILCFGLKTDSQTHLFEGSKRLIELANSLVEIKTVCKCGKKAEISARIHNGKIVKNGEQIQIGGNESYVPMCYDCWIHERL